MEDAWIADSALLNTVDAVNILACPIAIGRRARLGEASGVAGFYAWRSEQRALLQIGEYAVAEQLRRAGVPAGTAVVEIGCGLGVLSTFLAALGWRATGLDFKRERIATARAVAMAANAKGLFAPHGHAPVFEVASFPAWTEGKRLARSVALVTNLLGSSTPERQLRIIRGLRAFDMVLIDMQRFFDRRESAAAIAAFEAQFLTAGFVPAGPAMRLGGNGHYVTFRPRFRGRQRERGASLLRGARRLVRRG